jgi:hypothetical protein
MDVRDSAFITSWSKDYVDRFLAEGEAGAAMAEALSDRYDVRLSYEPDEGIGWELTVVLDDTPGDEVFASGRVADLLLLGEDWQLGLADEIIVAAAEAASVA